MEKSLLFDNEIVAGILLNREFDRESGLSSNYLETKSKITRLPEHKIRQIIAELKETFKTESFSQRNAADFAGMTLITEAMQRIIFQYWHKQSATINSKLDQWLDDNFGSYNLDRVKQNYVEIFLFDENKLSSLFYPEIISSWITNLNPALKPFNFVFSDSAMNKTLPYSNMMNSIRDFFDKVEDTSQLQGNLIDFLRAPALLHPESIGAQLEYIKDNWADLLGDFYYEILRGLDFIKEAEVFSFGGPGEAQILSFGNDDEEYERFSSDSDWMPRLVIIAKSTYVWLDQLSKKYGRKITQLDQIPDEELKLLAHQGFTGIWFIGLWERSQASRRIKHLTGNQEAIASAYSLDDYIIAASLGGEAAMKNLSQRANSYGIRIGCDMVPNHTGIDSKWIEEHPQWYLQLPYSPYPNYSFSGEDLSHSNAFSVHIEDNYFTKSDAAVVFKYYDHRNERTRYIYHGNDGTGIPWNDTAQLNYLLPEVREAVISKIIDIAKTFPIIRFDAAMTLAKKHIQRLWFPEPGSGGDIPTRSQFGLTKAEFNQHMPEEFWREVVDRVAEEAPNTLLLAEAFWMMEGFFVRTLGMHRVYNSAFMHMLKNEENRKYRESIFNIIEFNPQILKRFVNFMSNPDEETAIDQFGSDDKYFGVCILMATMPGLPMFAHGQIEGFTEKYGMEFSKARMDEQVNQHLVARHEREIFPLLRKRIIFSEVDNFLLYDFQSVNSYVDDNVFAYSNEHCGQFSLVIYHNKYAETTGNIKYAKIPNSDNENTGWQRVSLSEALKISDSPNTFIVFKDSITNLFYIRSAAEIRQNGMFIYLGAFKYHVFIDFRQFTDHDGRWKQLAEYLDGKGTDNIDISLRKLKIAPLLKEMKDYLSPEFIRSLLPHKGMKVRSELYKEIDFRAWTFYDNFCRFNDFTLKTDKSEVSAIIAAARKCFIHTDLSIEMQSFQLILILLQDIKTNIDFPEELTEGNTWFDEFLFSGIIEDLAMFDSGLISLITEILALSDLTCKSRNELADQIKHWLQRNSAKQYLKVNVFDDIVWFDGERMKTLLTCLRCYSDMIFANQTYLKKTSIHSLFEKLKLNIIKSEYHYRDYLELF